MPSPHYPNGDYLCVIKRQRWGVLPSANATDYFALVFEPIQANDGGELPEPAYEREVLLYFTQKAAPHSIKRLRELGWEGARLTELEPGSPNHHSFAGVELVITCGRNDAGYEAWSLPMAGQIPKESDRSVAAKLDRLFGKQLSVGAKKKPSPEPAMAAAGVDEIPF